jgi:hypothetical protein
MKPELLYNTGAIISFLGWFLAFSPHLLHHALSFLPDDHTNNIYVGMAFGLLGLGMMYAVRKKC